MKKSSRKEQQKNTRYVIVDCESTGPTPYSHELTEFAAIDLVDESYFHAQVWPFEPHPDTPALPVIPDWAGPEDNLTTEVFTEFHDWLGGGRCVFISDNPAFDWQWIAHGFAVTGLDNPFGFSGRRIGDLAAGLSGNWRNTSKWKRWRKTAHDHNPLNDVKGNREALLYLMEKYDQKVPGLG